jgi:DnaJ-class molecular chaperone
MCPECKGKGRMPDGNPCPECGGTGMKTGEDTAD